MMSFLGMALTAPLFFMWVGVSLVTLGYWTWRAWGGAA